MFKSITQILLSVLFIAFFAQLYIDVPVGESNIPITGQTFAVLLVAYNLGSQKGLLAIIAYVLLGILGVPIFADGKAGMEILLGGSGGFLIGFIASAYPTGLWGEKGWRKDFLKSLFAMTIGTIIILIFGIGRLSQLYGLSKGLEYGFYPFWQGAIVKIILGAAVLPIFYKIKATLSGV